MIGSFLQNEPIWSGESKLVSRMVHSFGYAYESEPFLIGGNGRLSLLVCCWLLVLETAVIIYTTESNDKL